MNAATTAAAAASGELCGKFEPVAGAEGTGPIVGTGGGRVLGWTENPEDRGSSFLYCVDVPGPKLVFKIPLPCPLPVSIGSNQQEAWDFRLGPDGFVWTFLDRVLVRIDPADGAIRPLGRLDRPGRIAPTVISPRSLAPGDSPGANHRGLTRIIHATRNPAAECRTLTRSASEGKSLCSPRLRFGLVWSRE